MKIILKQKKIYLHKDLLLKEYNMVDKSKKIKIKIIIIKLEEVKIIELIKISKIYFIYRKKKKFFFL
jgi:hypothetical protein